MLNQRYIYHKPAEPHGLLTEDSGGLYPKIKQSYFTFGDPSLWRDDITGRRVDRTLVDKDRKMKSLAIEALTKVHFPSLKRIDFRLSPGKTFSNREEELRDAFVYMTMGLAYLLLNWKNFILIVVIL